jgi:hypothetical protein
MTSAFSQTLNLCDYVTFIRRSIRFHRRMRKAAIAIGKVALPSARLPCHRQGWSRNLIVALLRTYRTPHIRSEDNDLFFWEHNCFQCCLKRRRGYVPLGKGNLPTLCRTEADLIIILRRWKIQCPCFEINDHVSNVPALVSYLFGGLAGWMLIFKFWTYLK